MTKLLASLRLLWAHHKPTMILMAAACVAAIFFAVQFAFDHKHYRGRPPERPEVEAWMTIRYVAHAYNHGPRDIREAIGYRDEARKLSFQDIAAQQGRSAEALIADLNLFLEAEEQKRREKREKDHRDSDKKDDKIDDNDRPKPPKDSDQ